LTSPPTVLVLASGRGERFLASGGTTHKLRALLAGKPVLQHVLDAVRASGMPWHVEDAGHPGMGDSIAAAVRATQDANGWLILPGDLPLIQGDTLRSLAQALVSPNPPVTPVAGQAHGTAPRQAQHHDVVIPVCNGKRGHPVGFSSACRDALLGLTGAQGAAAIMRARTSVEISVTDVGTVIDIDTVQDLQQAQALLDAR
jgi:molybdenum cofactor cytidylyltransferase